MLGFITRGDYRVMLRANQWFAPRWVRLWAMAATRLGDGWLWCALSAGILVWGDDRRVRAFASIGLAIGGSTLAFMALKHLTGRTRPCELEPHCWATLLPPDRFSFPSGHTMTAFAVTVAAGSFYPVLIPALLACAFSIAASRVLLGMHFLSDVLAGAAIGAALGFSSAYLLA